jgi:flagellar M-ring protein FliF
MALVSSNDLDRARESVRRFAAGFTPGQKAVTIAAVAGVLIVAVAYMTLSGKPTYSVLFSGLRAQDAASITQQLGTDHVPYELADAGSTILVPANDVAQARLTAAAAGLPAQGTVGLTLLDKTGLTTSQLTQQADYLQAIQGELEQTIDAIGGVSSSQVNVAEAANQAFALGNTRPSGASVLVTMDPGRSLSGGEVQAIVHLVASSVPGLDAGDVTVADNSGDLLAGPGVGGSAAENTQTASYDDEVAAKIQAYLASVFGPGSSDVQVDATLNFDKVRTVTHRLLGGTKGTPSSFCTSTQKSTTTYTGTATPPGGVAGSVTGAAAGSGPGSYSQTQTSRTCETSSESQTVTQPTGTVARESIAVLLDSRAVPRGTTLAAIRRGVAAAADLQVPRGDVLSFAAVPFSTAGAAQEAAATRAAAAAAKRSQLASMAKEGAALLAVLVLVLLVWLGARRRRRVAVPVPVLDPGVLGTFTPTMLEDAPTGEIPRVAGPSVLDRGSAEIEQFIDEQPGEVASVLRSWLRQDSGSAEHAGAPR